MKKISFTKLGYEQKKKEYEELLNKRPYAVSELRKAREMGDLSENGYYKSSRARLSEIDRNLRHLKYLLKYAQIVTATKSDKVQIGSVVQLKNDDELVTYTLVGDTEADPLNFKISPHSPIGRALMERKVGDKITVTIPSGTISYIITSIK